MCTSIAFRNPGLYFGRNMDLEYSFDEKIVITPRNYEINFTDGSFLKSHSAFIGMATVIDDYPLYADAMNEDGLIVSALNFPDNAYYFDKREDFINVSPYEFIPWILGNFKSVATLKETVRNVSLFNLPFNEEIPLAPLHFMVSDKNSTIVIEQTKEGLKVYDNPTDVLTNNPTLPFHLEHLKYFMGISTRQPENTLTKELDISPDSVGFGQIGLPGDNTSSSRFIRAFFNLKNAKCEETLKDSITNIFHILDTVKMLDGTTHTQSGECEITRYSCCMSTEDMCYYYTTYQNRQINRVSLRKENLNISTLIEYPLDNMQKISFQN